MIKITKRINLLVLLLFTFCTISCTSNDINSDNEALQILKKVNIKHNINGLLDGSLYSFIFRTNKFKIQKTTKGKLYISESNKDNQFILDSLINGNFVRYIDGEKKNLTEEDLGRTKNGLNSVLYFATLPLTLNDKAVIIKKLDDKSLMDEQFYCLQVSFIKEGGGDDYDDVFLYWINKKTNAIDYLAYYYHTNKGGLRLRKAFNRRYVNGVLFQDYINYKPTEKKLTVDALLDMFNNQKELEELSFILTEQVSIN